MSEMIERVARALCENNGYAGDAFSSVTGLGFSWAEQEERNKAVYRTIARAVVSALRMAPSEPRKMLRGAREELMPTHEEVDEEMFRKKWNARIDEALK